jgi:hypothetical protein
MMLFAFDLDGTLDADPEVFLALMQALRTSGNRVVVATGYSGPVTPEVITAKKEYLATLGFANAYDELVVFADPPTEAKAAWLKTNRADCLIDNNRANAEVVSANCLVLVPWATRVGNKNANN